MRCTGVCWSGLKGSMPGPSLYSDCPIFTMECHVGSMPLADGNSRSTCSRSHQACRPELRQPHADSGMHCHAISGQMFALARHAAALHSLDQPGCMEHE